MEYDQKEKGEYITLDLSMENVQYSEVVMHLYRVGAVMVNRIYR